MEDEKDAFGQMLFAFWRGEESYEIIERDDGVVEALSPGRYFSQFTDWLPAEQQAISVVRGDVIDIGCGAGRHALHLQEKGYRVLATDVSPLAIHVSKERGVIETRTLSITEIIRRHDMGLFDTVMLFGNNFGLLGNFKRAKWLLRRFQKMTTSKGRIIAGTLNPYSTEKDIHLAYHARNRQRGRMSGQIRFRIRFRQYATTWFDYLFVSPEELHEIVAGTGWQVAELFGETEGLYVALLEKE